MLNFGKKIKQQSILKFKRDKIMENRKMPQLLTIKELIQILRISKTTCKRWIKYNHPIKKNFIKLGRRWFITKEDLIQFIDEQKGQYWEGN